VIREEGWKTYSAGGIDAMQALFDAVRTHDESWTNILDKAWDGIGVEAHGHWIV
jgi:hypothetical protein